MQSKQDCFGVPSSGSISTITVQGASANPATNSALRAYSAVKNYTGAAIVYLPNQPLGDSFLITQDGMYSLLAVDLASGSATNGTLGFSVNATTQLSGNVDNLVYPNQLGYTSAAVASVALCYSTVAFLKAGSIIRVHGNGTGGGTLVGSNSSAMCTITKVA